MKKIILIIIATFLVSCASSNASMSMGSTAIHQSIKDLKTVTDYKQATVNVFELFGIIDPARILNYKTAGSYVVIPSIPLVPTSIIYKDYKGYALRKLMDENPGYDMVLDAQYTIDTENLFFGIIKWTSVTIKARFGNISR